MTKKLSALALSAATALTLSAPGAFAQDGTFGLELNNARDVESSCRLTYVATNNTGSELEETSYEVAVFDAQGGVSRLLILEFGRLQKGKTKVVQFDLSGESCANISRLLVNNVDKCVTSDGTQPDCMGGLVTSSRSDIDFGI